MPSSGFEREREPESREPREAFLSAVSLTSLVSRLSFSFPCPWTTAGPHGRISTVDPEKGLVP